MGLRHGNIKTGPLYDFFPPLPETLSLHLHGEVKNISAWWWRGEGAMSWVTVTMSYTPCTWHTAHDQGLLYNPEQKRVGQMSGHLKTVWVWIIRPKLPTSDYSEKNNCIGKLNHIKSVLCNEKSSRRAGHCVSVFFNSHIPLGFLYPKVKGMYVIVQCTVARCHRLGDLNGKINFLLSGGLNSKIKISWSVWSGFW